MNAPLATGFIVRRLCCLGIQVFVFTEQFVVIYNELLVSFGLALVAVLALSLLVLGKVAVVLLVCTTVVRYEKIIVSRRWEVCDGDDDDDDDDDDVVAAALCLLYCNVVKIIVVRVMAVTTKLLFGDP